MWTQLQGVYQHHWRSQTSQRIDVLLRATNQQLSIHLRVAEGESPWPRCNHDVHMGRAATVRQRAHVYHLPGFQHVANAPAGQAGLEQIELGSQALCCNVMLQLCRMPCAPQCCDIVIELASLGVQS